MVSLPVEVWFLFLAPNATYTADQGVAWLIGSYAAVVLGLGSFAVSFSALPPPIAISLASEGVTATYRPWRKSTVSRFDWRWATMAGASRTWNGIGYLIRLRRPRSLSFLVLSLEPEVFLRLAPSLPEQIRRMAEDRALLLESRRQSH